MKNSEFKNVELIKEFVEVMSQTKYTKNQVLIIAFELKLKVKYFKKLYLKCDKVEGKMWNPFRPDLKFAINELYAWKQILKTL